MHNDDIQQVRKDLKSHATRMLPDKIRSRVNSSDLVQETLIITITKLSKLTSCSKSTIYKWMLTVMRYRILHHNRAVNKEKLIRSNISNISPIEQMPDDLLQGLMKEEFADIITKLLRNQKDENKKIFQMRYIEGMDLETIAESTGKSVNSIRSILYRIILDLRLSISEEVLLR